MTATEAQRSEVARGPSPGHGGGRRSPRGWAIFRKQRSGMAGCRHPDALRGRRLRRTVDLAGIRPGHVTQRPGRSWPRRPGATRSAPTTPAAPSSPWCAGAPASHCSSGLAATVDLHDHRHPGGDRRRVTTGAHRCRAGPAHGLVPRHPVPAARRRPRDHARRVAAERHHRHRHHVLAQHGPARPRPDAVRRGTALPRTGPRPRRRRLAPDETARPAQRHAARPRQHHADRRRRDPLRDDARLPRARRPATSVSWGSILEDAFNGAAISPGRLVVPAPAGLCVVVVVLAFTLVGRALEVVLDPRMRER